jgi:UDP-N-acetylmuramate dehydrogenase
LAGLENLSYIPGAVGAAPVQNIGAYGVEVASMIESVCAIDTVTMKEVVISNADCEFIYRGSTFKNNKSLIITHVNFKLRTLTAMGEYSLQLGYAELAKVSPRPESIQEVRDNVIKIRSRKLPDWHVIRNAGSFFQNPVISVNEYQKVKDILLNDYNIDNIPHYTIPNSENVKIPAGFLIDKLVMEKQNQSNNVYLWPSQNLVLCAQGDAPAADIINYSEYIINTIKNITGITLTPEVNIVGE